MTTATQLYPLSLPDALPISLSSRGYPDPGGSNAFVNAGTFTQQGTGTVQFFTYYTGVTFNNSGTVDVQGGTLSLASGLSNFSGTTLTGGTYLVKGTLQISNAD